MPQEGFCRSEGCLFSFFIPSSRGTTSPHPERLQSYSQGRSGHGAARQGATSTEQRWRIRSEGFGRKYSPLRVLDSHRTRFWRFFKCWLEKKPAGGGYLAEARRSGGVQGVEALRLPPGTSTQSPAACRDYVTTFRAAQCSWRSLRPMGGRKQDGSAETNST